MAWAAERRKLGQDMQTDCEPFTRAGSQLAHDAMVIHHQHSDQPRLSRIPVSVRLERDEHQFARPLDLEHHSTMAFQTTEYGAKAIQS
jgi:hypothetical protein